MITIGLMTGNSLDGVDAVMTDFGCGNIRDISFMSVPYSARLKKHMLELRKEILQFNSDMDKAFKTDLFKKTLKEYSDVCGITVENLIKQAGVAREKIAAIGISGQSTGAHNPPSVAGKTQPFTTQIFQPAKLAKATGIPVVYDIRSDDIFNGGEGAP